MIIQEKIIRNKFLELKLVGDFNKLDVEDFHNSIYTIYQKYNLKKIIIDSYDINNRLINSYYQKTIGLQLANRFKDESCVIATIGNNEIFTSKTIKTADQDGLIIKNFINQKELLGWLD